MPVDFLISKSVANFDFPLWGGGSQGLPLMSKSAEVTPAVKPGRWKQEEATINSQKSRRHFERLRPGGRFWRDAARG